MSNEIMKTHKDLDVWNKAVGFAETLYSLTAKFPKVEQYGLVSQIRRSSVSIPSNIAEGAARNSHKEFLQFLYVALGSLSELETQLILARRFKFIKDKTVFDDVELIRKLLIGLIKFLKNKKTVKKI
jgi:four helix bundle protein